MQIMNNPIAKLLFQKGGFGQTISRGETVERLNPIIEAHYRLNRSYERVIAQHPQDDVAATLRRMQKAARGDVGKLSETVLSAGGVHYNGTDLREADLGLSDDPTERLFQLRDREEAFRDRVADELDEITHQLRTQAILELVKTNSGQRLKGLREMTGPLHRPSTG